MKIPSERGHDVGVFRFGVILMRVIDAEGTFWLASNPEKRVFGRLRFDPQNGARLTTQGTFFDEVEVRPGGMRPSNTPVRILGLLGTEEVTLVNGSCVNRKTQFSARENIGPFFVEEYSIPFVAQGAHFPETELPTFETLSLRCDYLEPWVNDQLISRGTVQSSDGTKLQLTAVTNKSSSSPAAFGEAQVFSSIATSETLFDASFTQESQLNLTFHPCETLEGVLSYCRSLQHLLTIAALRPSRILSVGLTFSSRDALASSPTTDNYTKLCFLDHAARIPHDGYVPIPQNMLFTVDQLGGANFVAKWCEIGALFEPVIDQLMTPWYSPWADPENAFFSAAAAAETMIRIDTGRQNFTFKIELSILAESAGYAFQQLVGDVDQWASEIVRVRNNRVVHRGLHETAAMPNWYTMYRTLYHLVIVHLLKRCNVEEMRVDLVSRNLATIVSGR